MPPVECERRVRYVDLQAQFAVERSGLMAAVENVFSVGDFIGGADVELLEVEIGGYLGSAYVIALNSGTDALVFSLAALGIGCGDEVITVSNSFIATAAAITHVGATPVFADVRTDQLIDPASVLAVITSRTRAIMPVHLTGQVADIVALGEIAQRYDLAIVEDTAQAFGSRLGGRAAGTFGRIGAFSAHPLKNFNAAGDAGFIVTDDAALAERVKLLRNHGFVDRDTALEFGRVSRMDTLQAAVLRYRLQHIDGVIRRRRENAAAYARLVDATDVMLPHESANQFNSYHLFVIQSDERDGLRSRLEERGIGTKIHYPTPIHLQPAAHRLGYRLGSLPQTERQSKRILSLPVQQFLEIDDIAYVAGEINGFFG